MGFDLEIVGLPAASGRDLRLGTTTMARMVDVLTAAGALYQPERLDLYANGVSSGLAEELTTAARERRRVPAFKFLSNDGWLVSSEECLIIAEALEGYTPSDDVLLKWNLTPTEARTWIGEFVTYNRKASKHGGYRVY